MGFLEFLGSFETADGKWQDPFELKDMDMLEAQENEKSKTVPMTKEGAHDTN
jgi:hypothetical protein